MSKFENLFICVTPLQIVIAKRIIEEKQLLNVCFIVLFYNDNPKYRFYINSLKTENYSTIEYLVNSQKKFDRLIEIFKLKIFLNKINLSTENIYLASIENSLIHTILSKINFQNLVTFDDGLANLYYQGQYYVDQESRLQKILKKILYISWSMVKIKQVSQNHYTIYTNHKNIINQTSYLSLFQPLQHCSTLPKLKIYIGQPLEEINPYFNKEFIEKCLQKLKVDSYLPHPREVIKYDNIHYINTEKILEDFYLEYMDKFNIQFYTFLSSSVLNIKMINPYCEIFILYDHYTIEKYSSIYDIFKKEKLSLICI